MDVVVRVQCERCTRAYSYPFTVSETLFSEEEAVEAKRKVQESVETRLVRADVGKSTCPLCGNLQSWMYPAVRDEAYDVLTWIGLLALSATLVWADARTGNAQDHGGIGFVGFIVCVVLAVKIVRRLDSLRLHFWRPQSAAPVRSGGPASIGRGQLKTSVSECSE